ncbi:MAG TPA: prenyltransferase/squalene oxidase repeat-containing protein [Thermoanaerobaculia bacterium]|nr:prenyltransferase/squalene oxidase repeat-containing protein [Thermoanaerobaculia bacterium]
MTGDTPQSPIFGPLGASPADRLSDPEVRKFFLGVLSSELPPEAKYDKFVEFFRLDSSLSRELVSYARELQSQDETKIRQALATAAQGAGLWNPGQILSNTEDCLRRAVRRLRVSQHRDGGWGYQVEISSVWATVYATLSLHHADQQGLGDGWVRSAVDRGIDWLMAHRAEWSAEAVPPHEERSIYELSVVIRCLCETGRDREPAIRSVIALCIARLLAAQNDDGGWDRSIWGTQWPASTRIWSEVGATSFALQILACAGRPGSPAALRAIACLAAAQNDDDGSWNIMIGRHLLDRGARSVTKTCDALKGILAGRRLSFDLAPYEERIAKAVEWLQRREQPIFNEASNITGWGWVSDELSTLENTCHTLETLLQLEDASLPLLTSNASWLMRSQFRTPGSAEDGKWANNDTGRITLSLLEFHRAIQRSALFAPAATETEATELASPGG